MKTAVSLGFFDGLHKGHLAVLCVDNSFHRVAVTFKTSPRAELSGIDEALQSFFDRCNALKKIGVDEVYALDFKKVKNIAPLEFLRFLKEKFNPSLISCGFNYRFGKNGQGDTLLLKKFCEKNGIELRVSEPVTQNGKTVSSSYVRELINKGDVKTANTLLAEPFSFKMPVIKGDQRGRTIDFPTINQEYPKDFVIPKFGVYKTEVSFDGKSYSGITNIGTRPTYPSTFIISETYILDFNGDLYGKDVKISLLELLREEKKFSSLEELKAQIAEDIKKI